MAVRRRHIRLLVEQLLDEHNITDLPVPVDKIAEAMGASVLKEPAPDELSGFLLRNHTNRETVIGVNSTHHNNRQRFTMAHELGHLLLHEGERVHVDQAGYAFRFRLKPNEPDPAPDDDETEANVFAAELLMPVRFLTQDMAEYMSRDFLDDDVIAQLARKYGVSAQALTFRLSHLGYIQL